MCNIDKPGTARAGLYLDGRSFTFSYPVSTYDRRFRGHAERPLLSRGSFPEGVISYHDIPQVCTGS